MKRMLCNKWPLLLLTAGLMACGGGGSGEMPEPPPPPPPPPPPWHTPTCEQVGGEPIATYSPDAGVTLRPTEHRLHVSMWALTGWLAAASEVAVLYATHGHGVYISRDAGCSWTLAYLPTPDDDTESFRAVVATERLGYVEPASNRHRVFVFDPDGLVAMRNLPTGLGSVAYATSPSDPGAVYLVTDGDPSFTGLRRFYRSGDEARSWAEIGSQETIPDRIREIAINPNNALHIVATRTGPRNPVITFDGGNTWTEAVGVAKGASRWSTFEVVFGGDEVTTDVWVRGLRTYWDEDLNIIGMERFIAHSTDGGLSFNDVVLEDGEIRLTQPTLATRPGVAGEVLFGGTVCGIGGYSPAIYHYRASDDSVTILDHQGSRAAFRQLLFNPVDPDVLYIGFDATANCPE